MGRFRIAAGLLAAVLGCVAAAAAFAGGAQEEGAEPSAAPEPVMERAGGAVTGFDLYNLDSGKISITSFGEAPLLAARVADGSLPPVEERLPDNPLVMEPWEEIGTYGGTLRTTSLDPTWDPIIRHAANAELIEMLSSSSVHHANLVGVESRPGVFEDWSISADGTSWTFTLRRGMKWSDGAPVTSEDARFQFQEVYENPDLYPNYPVWLVRADTPAEFEVVDDHTFRLNFAAPYGLLEVILHTHGSGGLAAMMKPSHYLKQFHRDHTDMDRILPRMKEEGFGDDEWARFMLATGAGTTGWDGTYMMNVMEPLEFPVLNPWRPVEIPGPGEYLFERNPYYFKIDTAGNQLPYIDYIRKSTAEDPEVLALKILTGDTDVEGGYFVKLSDYPLYVENQDQGNFDILLTKDWLDHPLIFFFNNAPADPVLRGLVQDPRLGQAMSLALDRQDFIESLFLGFGRPAQVSPVRGSPMFSQELEDSYAAYDPDRANALLDEMGLTWDANREFRLRPDGERLTIPLTYYEVFPAVTPGSELASQYWKAIGIDVPLRSMDGGAWWTAFQANEHVLTAWGLGSASVVPSWFFQGFSTTTPTWWRWYQSGGAEGVEPTAAGKRVYELRDIIQSTPSAEERLAASREVFEVQAEQLWVIGIAVDVPSPLVHSRRLGNIAIGKDFYNITVLDGGEQWFFKN